MQQVYKMQKVRKSQHPVVGLAMQVDAWVREEAAQRGWRLLNVWYGDLILPSLSRQSSFPVTTIANQAGDD